MNVFLGITGASGAPYAARLLEALRAAEVEVGLCVSRAGYEILATELYGDTTLSHEQILERFLEGRDRVTVHSEQDWRAPYASGSAKVDGYVICPCSMGTAGTIASGAMSNLIHRAASVAIKEGRKLVLVPRETPLSDIHLENLLRLRRAGAGGGDRSDVRRPSPVGGPRDVRPDLARLRRDEPRDDRRPGQALAQDCRFRGGQAG
jgi:4-hydroxy-3-polyprenylbenzoate decarboxylase